MDKWFKNNLAAKIIALVLALMLWMVVHLDELGEPNGIKSGAGLSNEIVRQIQGVKVDIRNAPEDYVVEQKEETVDLILKGDRTLLYANFTPDSYDVYIDLEGYKAGTQQVPVKVRGFPPGVEVEARPSSIQVTLEEKQRKEMQVVPEIIGNPKKGYTLGDPILNPIRVHVKGSESQLSKIAYVKASVNVNGASETVKKSVPLKVVDINGNIIQAEVEPSVTEITVPVVEPFVTVPLGLNLEGNPPPGYAIAGVTINPDKVTLYGDQKVLEGFEVYPLPPVNVNGMTKTQKIEITLPVEKNLSKVSPEKAEVTVEIVPSGRLEVADVPIQIKGAAEGVDVSLVTPEIAALNLVVEGDPKRLQQLSAEDIQAQVLVSNLPAGVHEVPVEIILPPYIKKVSSSVEKVTVKIQAKENKEMH